MSDRETCTICLDQLFAGENSLITRLQPCGHYYHTECMEPWKERSNTCPTCRINYDIIETIDKSHKVITSSIADKSEVVSDDDDDMFESLSDIEAYAEFQNLMDHRIERRINLLVTHSNICILCDSRRGPTTACNSCSAIFHRYCLGVEGLTHWICPMCDAEQGDFDRPSRYRRSRNSAITDRVYNELTQVSGRTIREISEVVVTPQVIPEEEQHAWETFELARNQQTNEEEVEVEKQENEDNYDNEPEEVEEEEDFIMRDQIVETDEVPKRFKRPSRRRTQQTHNTAPNIQPPISVDYANSLVNTIVGKLKEHRTLSTNSTTWATSQSSSSSGTRPNYAPHFQSPSEVSISTNNSNEEFSSFSPSSDTTCESSQSPITNRSVWKMNVENNSLTYEQKSALQEIVRSKLRPVYKDGIINFDQYTEINKKVSHVLYDWCLQEDVANPDFQKIAEQHVADEITKLQ